MCRVDGYLSQLRQSEVLVLKQLGQSRCQGKVERKHVAAQAPYRLRVVSKSLRLKTLDKR